MENSKESSTNFSWDNNVGYGYLPVSNTPYDDLYFDKYEKYEATEFGRKLNEWRVSIVRKLSLGKVLDIGIGCGSFIKLHGNSLGYDVCEKSIKWLKDRGLFRDPYKEGLEDVDCVTFFDSFEHIENLEEMVKRVCDKKIIMSIPVFSSKEEVLGSRHFRPNEHFHYFSINALIGLMRSYKMRCVWVSDYESAIGRDSIITFCFRKD